MQSFNHCLIQSILCCKTNIPICFCFWCMHYPLFPSFKEKVIISHWGIFYWFSWNYFINCFLFSRVLHFFNFCCIIVFFHLFLRMCFLSLLSSLSLIFCLALFVIERQLDFGWDKISSGNLFLLPGCCGSCIGDWEWTFIYSTSMGGWSLPPIIIYSQCQSLYW